MKKIIIILTSIFIASCNNRRAVEGDVIINVKACTETTSVYTVYGYSVDGIGMGELPKFHARKGLYNVGDTLKFCK